MRANEWAFPGDFFFFFLGGGGGVACERVTYSYS